MEEKDNLTASRRAALSLLGRAPAEIEPEEDMTESRKAALALKEGIRHFEGDRTASVGTDFDNEAEHRNILRNNRVGTSTQPAFSSLLLNPGS